MRVQAGLVARAESHHERQLLLSATSALRFQADRLALLGYSTALLYMLYVLYGLFTYAFFASFSFSFYALLLPVLVL